MHENSLKIRLDKWLWAARFFKTRSQAAQAIQGGRVHVNDARVKPSRTVTVGDVLTISKSELTFSVTVCGLSATRRSATEARLLYEESEQSRKLREEQLAMRRLMRAAGSPPEKRPGKRDRRKILEFIRKKQ